MRRVVRSGPVLLTLKTGTLLGALDSLLAAEPCLRAIIPWLLCRGCSAINMSSETLLSKVKFLRDYGEPACYASLPSKVSHVVM